MSSIQANGEPPIILHTEHLKLRLADPQNDADCEITVHLCQDKDAGKGGTSRIGINTVEDVRKKFQTTGPKLEYCTLAPPPYGQFFLVYLPAIEESEEDTLIGHIGIAFRPEMPYPDIGYATLGPFQGQGYTAEASRKVLAWWRNVIGVKKIWCGTMPTNVKSQKCAKRIGFVKAGKFDIVFQDGGKDERVGGGEAFVLPGMEWREGLTIYPTVH